MRMRLTTTATLFSFAIALASLPVPAVADSFEYVTANNGQFGTVDLQTGKFTSIGTTTGNPLAGIAALNGTLYSVNSSNQLVTIDPTTGTTTVVGATGASFIVVAGSGSHLFGMDASDNLYSINLTTGAATLIGSTGITPLGNNAYTNSLAGNGSDLFYTEELGGGGSVLASTLFRIDETTGISSAVGLTGIHDIAGAGFTDSTFYGYTSPFLVASTVPSLYSVDTTTGTASFVATLDPALEGSVFGGTTAVPEPSSWTFLLAGMVLIASARILRRPRLGSR